MKLNVLFNKTTTCFARVPYNAPSPKFNQSVFKLRGSFLTGSVDVCPSVCVSVPVPGVAVHGAAALLRHVRVPGLVPRSRLAHGVRLHYLCPRVRHLQVPHHTRNRPRGMTSHNDNVMHLRAFFHCSLRMT